MEVKHFIACVDTLRILPLEPQRSVLHDVRYTHIATPEEGFPCNLGKICLFARFYGGVGSYRFIVRVNWENSAGDRRELRQITSRPLEFSPAKRAEDFVFAIHDIMVPGIGRVEFHLTTLEEPEIIFCNGVSGSRFMNKFPKPEIPIPGTRTTGGGVLVVEMEDFTEADLLEPPREVWRVVGGKWKLVSLVRPDGTIEPLPVNPPSIKVSRE